MILPAVTKIKDAVKGKASLSHTRSSRWPTVRKKHLKENSTCAVCGGTNKLEVHHIIPFHENRELELEPSNLITLCESKSFGVVCHLLFGHLGSYKKINPNVLEDTKTWREKINKRKN